MNKRGQDFVNVLRDEGCTLQTCMVEIEPWVEPLRELLGESSRFWDRHIIMRDWLDNAHHSNSISSADYYRKPALYAYTACKESGLGVEEALKKVAKVLGEREGVVFSHSMRNIKLGCGSLTETLDLFLYTCILK